MDLMPAQAYQGFVTGTDWVCAAPYAYASTDASHFVDGFVHFDVPGDQKLPTTNPADLTWVITQLNGSTPGLVPTISATGASLIDGFDFNYFPVAQGTYANAVFSCVMSYGGVALGNPVLVYFPTWAMGTVTATDSVTGTVDFDAGLGYCLRFQYGNPPGAFSFDIVASGFPNGAAWGWQVDYSGTPAYDVQFNVVGDTLTVSAAAGDISSGQVLPDRIQVWAYDSANSSIRLPGNFDSGYDAFTAGFISV